ncbi:YcdB/YcdC domain-containing protein [Desnuesiella massiliensis]|uniref:YcdB/YcdC domain-containing protein n=1 Tax=Desnuesiella massiliensis TaxID=1650662 RepID=UPI0006E17D71|nr:YcdB/YcdC domain-containing protein [Desnuesiella massiliensis]
MKNRKIISALLVFSIFLTSCGNFSSIKKNQLVIEKLDKNATSTSDISDKKKVLTEEEAKLKALEVLEKYFNIKLYLTEVACYVQFESSSTIKKYLDEVNPNSYSKEQLEYSKSVLENGLYEVIFYNKVEKQSENIEIKYFSMKMDPKTGECLSVDGYYNDKMTVSSKSSINIDEAKKIAEEFILKENIGNIKNTKLVNQNQRRQNENVNYRLLFEDADAAYKKVLICIDGNTKKVYGFSIGVMEIIHFSTDKW